MLTLLPSVHSSSVRMFLRYTGQQVIALLRHVSVLLLEACAGSVTKKAIVKILTACDCNLSNCSHKETCVFFGDWLPGLSVRAITTLICISQLLLRCHPSANQCTVTVPRCLSPVEVSQLQSQKPAAKSVSTGSDNVTFDWAFLFNPL